MSQAKWRTILAVHREGQGMNQKALADRLGIEGPTLVRLLDRLAADGWVERRACPGDKRSKLIYLLPRATEMIKHIDSVATQLRQELLSGFSDAELKTSYEVLKRIRSKADSLP